MTKSRVPAKELVLVVCLAVFAAGRVGLHALTFPVFGHVDEIQHVDTLLKYARGQLPSLEDQYLPESSWLKNYYGSPEFMPPGTLPMPPVDWAPELRERYLDAFMARRRLPPQFDHNYEALQPPTYYVAAAAWRRVGQLVGISGGIVEVFFVRTFNAVIAAAMVLAGFWLVCIAVPASTPFLRLGAPALLAVMPQDTFYFIANDAMGAPLSALTLILMFLILRRDEGTIPNGFGIGFVTGLCAGLTFLVKISQLILFFGIGVLVLQRALILRKRGRRILDSAHVGLALGAAIPMASWVAYCSLVSGEALGTHHKTVICGWGPQTWEGFVGHPMWTLEGLFTFIRHLSAKFWRGETHWQGLDMGSPAVDLALLVLSALCLTAAALGSWRHRGIPGGLTISCFAILGGGFVMLSYACLGWSFDHSAYPSKEFPFVFSSRLLTAGMVPFAILFVHGLDRLTRWLGRVGPTVALLITLLTLLVSEAVLTWPVLHSKFNFWNSSA